MNIRALNSIPPWEWPESAATTVLDVLADRTAAASDRLLAAELAGEITVASDQIAEALLAIIRSQDESEELRGSAAIALGPALEYADMMDFQLDEDEEVFSEAVLQRVQESLRLLFFEEDLPRDVRRRILEASVRSPQEWHGDAIRTAYASDEAEWRLTALFCMRYVRGFDREILEAIENEDTDIHYQAVHAAGNWELEDAWSHVVELASDEGTEKRLRLAAIEAVATIRPQKAGEVIADLLDHPDDEIAEAAEEALTMAGATLNIEDYDEEDDDQFLL